MDEAGAQLAGGWAVWQIGFQIRRTGQQLARSDFRFEYIAEFAVGNPVVDHLDQRFQVVIFGQDEWPGVLLDFPPLPVGMIFRRKKCQRRMSGITKYAKRMGRLP